VLNGKDFNVGCAFADEFLMRGIAGCAPDIVLTFHIAIRDSVRTIKGNELFVVSM